MKKILFPIILSGLIFSLSAQIRGTVTDTGNNPIAFAKVVIYSLPDSVQIAGTIANKRGEFIFRDYYSVNKLMKVSFDGYKTKSFRALPEQNVKLRGGSAFMDVLVVK